MLYNAPTGSTDPNAPFIGKNVAAGIQGSKIPPKAVEMPQREIVNTISAAGMTPTNDDPNQLLRAIRGGKLEYYIDGQATPGGAISPTAGSPAISPSPAHTSLFDGLHVRVKMGSPCTGPTNLGVNALSGAIKRRGFVQLVGGEWATGDILDLTYSSAAGAFQICGLTSSDVAALIATASPNIWRLGSATAGTTSALQTTLTGGVPTGNFFFAALISATNTLSGGATTIDFGAGAKAIVFDVTGGNIPAGALPGGIGFVAMFFYDGTYARVLNVSAAASPTSEASFKSTSASASAAGVVVVPPVTGPNPPFGTISGGVFTATKAGLYSINGFLTYSSASTTNTTTYYYALLYRNGSVVDGGTVTGTQGTQGGVGTTFGQSIPGFTVYLNIGDTINLAGSVALGSGSFYGADLEPGCVMRITKVT